MSETQAKPESVLSHGLVAEPSYPLLDPANVRLGVDRGDGVLGTMRPYPTADSADAVYGPAAALRELWLDDDGIVALVGVHIYTQRLPAGGTTLFPCLLIFQNQGQNDPEIKTIEVPTLQVQIFGRSVEEAHQIYWELRRYDGEAQIPTTHFLFHTINETTGAASLLVPISDSQVWDCVSCQWSAEISRR